MSTITIAAKQSNTGTIHDLASERGDRVINFGKLGRYAVLVPAYYNVRHTVCRSEAAAVKRAKALKQYAPTVIDAKGNYYTLNTWGELELMR